MIGCRPLTDDEIERIILNGFSGKHAWRNLALFSVGLNTGFRVHELLSLKIGDVFKNDTVVYYVARPRGAMKRQKAGRTKKIQEQTRDILREWIKQAIRDYGARPHWPLFFSQKNRLTPITRKAALKILKTAFEEAGLVATDRELGTHSMRKTFANRVYNFYMDEFRLGKTNEPPMYAVQRALGHFSIKSTLQYMSFKYEEIPDEELAIIKSDDAYREFKRKHEEHWREMKKKAKTA